MDTSKTRQEMGRRWLGLAKVSVNHRRWSFWAVLPAFVFSAMLMRAGILPEPAIVEKSQNHRVWQTVRELQIGENTVLKTNSYTELSLGIYYPAKGTGELLESQESVRIVNGSGVADQGVHQVFWSPSIDDSPNLTYTTPEGQIFKMRILCLAYADRVSGKNSLL